MLLYLIRHGQTDWNRDRRIMGLGEVPLNDAGREAVRALALELEREAIPVIYTSTVARALETARILAGRWNAELREEPRLNESPYERWVGRRYSELRDDPDFKLYATRPTLSRFSESEAMADIQRRALEAVRRAAADAGAEKAALVSHSDVLKPIIAHYLRMDLDSMHRLSIANASVTLVDTGAADMPRIRYVNATPWKRASAFDA